MGGYPGFDTGSKYDPVRDSWKPISTAGVPGGRYQHTAVWNGIEMIIWGGYWAAYFNTGGRYNPLTDSWTLTSTIDAPSGRNYHASIWTGTEMIVWGGYYYDGTSHYYNTGGKYNPSTDSWTSTSISGAPEPRRSPTAIWTDSEMIVWGGSSSSTLNTGGKYCAVATFTLLSHKSVIDDSGSPTNNGIIETDEIISLKGSLTNMSSGIASSVTGTLSTTDPITIINPVAIYPNINPGATANCATCYSIIAPATNRPQTHWDFMVTESPTCSGCSPASYDFTYHVGNSFSDVSPSQLFYFYIEKLLHNNVTSGCTASTYCTGAVVQRQAMTKFLCNAMNARTPNSCVTANCALLFADVPATNPFCPYIEAIYNAGISSGCQSAPLLFCPATSTQRQAMAKFVCNAMSMADPGSCSPSSCTGMFSDVPPSNIFCPYIEAIASAGIVSGCAPSLYCPAANVLRDQMAKFIVNAFGLTL